MQANPIYTIGYGNRTQVEFLKLLNDFAIKYLIDVRTLPYSKHNPAFSQNELKFFLERNSITYVFMGDALGGKPQDNSCYNEDGKVDYEILKHQEFFKQGVARLKVAYEKGVLIALMCSEMKPGECHRSKLIGRALTIEGISLVHIDENGRLKTQADIINQLNKGRSDVSLFPDEVKLNTTSTKPYI